MAVKLKNNAILEFVALAAESLGRSFLGLTKRTLLRTISEKKGTYEYNNRKRSTSRSLPFD